jgi:hypothetical protein
MPPPWGQFWLVYGEIFDPVCVPLPWGQFCFFCLVLRWDLRSRVCASALRTVLLSLILRPCRKGTYYNTQSSGMRYVLLLILPNVSFCSYNDLKSTHWQYICQVLCYPPPHCLIVWPSRNEMNSYCIRWLIYCSLVLQRYDCLINLIELHKWELFVQLGFQYFFFIRWKYYKKQLVKIWSNLNHGLRPPKFFCFAI